jgi:DNA-damage-inducible protein D
MKYWEDKLKQELIVALFQKFEEACYLYNQIECWSARDLQEILGYTKWDNLKTPLQKPEQHVKMPGFPSQIILPMSGK